MREFASSAQSYLPCSILALILTYFSGSLSHVWTYFPYVWKYGLCLHSHCRIAEKKVQIFCELHSNRENATHSTDAQYTFAGGNLIISSLNIIWLFKLVNRTSRKVKLFIVPSDFSLGPIRVYNHSSGVNVSFLALCSHNDYAFHHRRSNYCLQRYPVSYSFSFLVWQAFSIQPHER